MHNEAENLLEEVRARKRIARGRRSTSVLIILHEAISVANQAIDQSKNAKHVTIHPFKKGGFLCLALPVGSVLPVIIKVDTERPSIPSGGVEEFLVANLAQRKEQEKCQPIYTFMMSARKREFILHSYQFVIKLEELWVKRW